MKTMLITGGSSGIGAACANYFAHSYKIITVSRSGNPTIKGDLTDLEFTKSLIEKLSIDILINNAGILSDSFEETFNVNTAAASFLAAGFYQKMNSGHIINICSTASHLRGWPDMPKERIWYLASKAALKDLGIVLQNSRNSNVKVTNLEPGWVNTNFGNGQKEIPSEEYENQTQRQIPMQPLDVARTIEWILQQPQHIVIHTLQMDNFIINSSSDT